MTAEWNIERSNCPVCASSQREDVWCHSSGIVNSVCLDCGLTYLSHRHRPKIGTSGYEDYRQSYSDEQLLALESLFWKDAQSQHDILSEVGGKWDSVLEIGSAYGHFLNRFPTNCIRVGIEPSLEQAVFAREKLHCQRIFEGTYEKNSNNVAKAFPEGFNLVCSFHVLEHVRQPLDLLEFARSQLKDDGLLFISVPDIHTLHPDFIELYFLYRSWHVQTFSMSSLCKILLRGGFEPIRFFSELSSVHLSSIACMARKARKKIYALSSEKEIAKNIQAAREFHRLLEAGVKHFCSRVAEWVDEGRRVAFYGGGLHTQSVLELAGFDEGSIIAVIDDNPKLQGTWIAGIPVYSFSSCLEQGIDVVVVSTLASEQAILHRLEKVLPPNIQLIGIYRDIMKLERV